MNSAETCTKKQERKKEQEDKYTLLLTHLNVLKPLFCVEGKKTKYVGIKKLENTYKESY